MQCFETAAGLVVRLDLDEEIVGTLTALIKERGIKGGTISGIGAVKNTTLGYFDAHQKRYDERLLEGELELLALNGNVSWVPNDEGNHEPFVHLHALVSGPDYVALGGHLFSAEIAVTGEIMISPTEVALARAYDDRTGLKLIDRQLAR